MILAIAAVAAAAEEEVEVVAAVGVALTKNSLFGFSGQPMQCCGALRVTLLQETSLTLGHTVPFKLVRQLPQ